MDQESAINVYTLNYPQLSTILFQVINMYLCITVDFYVTLPLDTRSYTSNRISTAKLDSSILTLCSQSNIIHLTRNTVVSRIREGLFWLCLKPVSKI